MLQRVDRLLLRVSHLDGAVRYYRDVLGMELVRRDGRVAAFALGGDGAELVLHNDPDLPDNAVYYLVDDVRDLYRRREELKLTFVSPPAAVSKGYRATVKDPFGTVLLLLDRSMAGSASAQTVEDARAPGALFPGVEARTAPKRDLLVQLYEQVGRTADDLPYTPHFETLYRGYVANHADPQPTRGEVWRHLLNLRKGGKLPKLGEARSQPPQVTSEAREQLRRMLGEDIGRRDRLPYTERFDALVDAFNQSQPRPISPHLVWRLVATLAK